MGNKPQARAPKTQPFGREAFDASDGTVLRWLGMAGIPHQQARDDLEGGPAAGRLSTCRS